MSFHVSMINKLYSFNFEEKGKEISIAVVFALIIPNAIWIALDRSVWPWDMAWYAEVTTDLWYTLTKETLSWPRAMISAFGGKAPGIAWFGQFFVLLGQLINSIEIGLLLSIFGLYVGSLVLIYKVGKVFFPDRIGAPLVGCIMYSASPLAVGMTHQYLTEVPQLFAITYFFWIAAKSTVLEKEPILLHILLATSLAISIKITSPIYCIFPALIALFAVMKKRPFSGKTIFLFFKNNLAILSFSLLIFLFTACWYLENIFNVVNFASLAASSDIALDYGKRDLFLNKLVFWLSALKKSFFLPETWTIFLAVFVLAIIGLIRGIRKHSTYSVSNPLAMLSVASLLHISGVIALFSLNINEENRYLLPLLPSLVVLAYLAIYLLNKKLVTYALIISFSWQWIVVSAIALNILPMRNDISHWLYPYDNSDMKMKEVENVANYTCNEKSNGLNSMVGVEMPWMNYNTLSFYSAKSRLLSGIRCNYVYLGHAEKDIEKAWARVNYHKVVYFVSIQDYAQPSPPDFLNTVSLPVLERVKHDHEYADQKFLSNNNVVIYGNTSLLAKLPLYLIKRFIVVTPLRKKMREALHIDYNPVTVNDLDNIWLHPLPPRAGLETAIAITLSRPLENRIESSKKYINYSLSIEDDKSAPIVFKIELKSQEDGKGDTLAVAEKVVSPSKRGELLLVPLPEKGAVKSFILSTKMENSSDTNAFAHAKFSDFHISN